VGLPISRTTPHGDPRKPGPPVISGSHADRVEWVGDERRLAALAPAWDRLSRERDQTPFTRHGWFSSWWKAFGAGRELSVCTAWRGGALVGVLPLTLLNPATVIYFSALVLGRQAQGTRSVAASVVFVLAAFAASASWQLLIAASGSAVGRVLAGPRGRFGTALVSSVLIGVLAVALLVRIG